VYKCQQIHTAVISCRLHVDLLIGLIAIFVFRSPELYSRIQTLFRAGRHFVLAGDTDVILSTVVAVAILEVYCTDRLMQLLIIGPSGGLSSWWPSDRSSPDNQQSPASLVPMLTFSFRANCAKVTLNPNRTTNWENTHTNQISLMWAARPLHRNTQTWHKRNRTEKDSNGIWSLCNSCTKTLLRENHLQVKTNWALLRSVLKLGNLMSYSVLRDPAVGPDKFRRDLKTYLFTRSCDSFAAH